MSKIITGLAVAGALLSSTVAAAKDIIHPLQVGAETVRYDQGDWVLDLQRPAGAVQIQAVGDDHGRRAFSVVILNGTGQPLNFDTSNIRVEGPVPGIRVLTRQDMEAAAKKRARTAMFLTALAGGVAAVSAANARDHYRATTFTPNGTYRTFVSVPNPNAGLNAALITGGTAASIALMQKRLDETRAGLKNEMIQMTTVDPGSSYGGLIYLSKFKTVAPADLKMWVRVGAEEYPFAVRFVRKGTPAPTFTVATPPPASAVTPAPTAAGTISASPGAGSPPVRSVPVTRPSVM